MRMQASWTWLVYIATHNNVDAWGAESVAKMRAAALGDSVRVLVQQDTPSGCVRRMIGADPEVVADLGEVDSGDPQALLDFVRWGVAAAPAERYALVLWSHGTGWEPSELERLAQQRPAPEPVTPGELQQRDGGGAAREVFFSTTMRMLLARPTRRDRAIAFDDGSGHSLDTIELGGVIAQITELLGRPLDLLAMNACHMASVEVAYQVQQASASSEGRGTVYVATEDYMPAHSLPYDDILTRLGAQPGMGAAQIGRMVVERYCAFFRDPELDIDWARPGWPEGVTLIALDLAAIDRLAVAVQALVAALRADLAAQFDALSEAHIAARVFSPLLHLYDLRSLCDRLSAQPGLPAATAAAARAVVVALSDPALCLARDHTAQGYAELGGLTTYMLQPDAEGRFQPSPAYAETAYAAATGWGALLLDYHALA